jgi:drug/metabolite transporter (DMT)-like permease
MLASQAFFLLSDGIIKIAGETMPPSQIMALRGGLAIYLVGAALVARAHIKTWYLVLHPLVLLRALIEGTIAVLFIGLLQNLELNAITVLTQVTPLILAVASAWMLGERVGAAGWYTVFLGFIGVVMVAQPSIDGLNIHVIGALVVALLMSARELVTRFINPAVPTAAITFTTTVAVCAFGFAGIEQAPWVPVTAYGGTLLAMSALLVAFGSWAMVLAFRNVDVSVVSRFRYSAVAWGILWGYLLFEERPNDLALAGMALIILSGLFAMHQETTRLRRRAAGQQAEE